MGHECLHGWESSTPWRQLTAPTARPTTDRRGAGGPGDGCRYGSGDVNLNAIAAAVISGTSLFGGRGTAFAALLGIIVIQSISSGLTLLNLDSSFRFIVTGIVLLLAVTLDSVTRRSRTSHGRA